MKTTRKQGARLDLRRITIIDGRIYWSLTKTSRSGQTTRQIGVLNHDGTIDLF
jgi:hypothetical protein